MTYFIDFICAAQAEAAIDKNKDWERHLSPRGKRQAEAFGDTRRSAGESYRLVLLSNVPRAIETYDAMFMGHEKPRYELIDELFDPRKPDDYSKRRRSTYADYGADTLSEYWTECYEAMDALGMQARQALSTSVCSTPGRNILVIGHAVYTNQIIFSTFFYELSSALKEELRTDPYLDPCAGYRLIFGNNGQVIEMEDLEPPYVEDD